MTVIYAEKASLARTIAAALGAGKRIASPKSAYVGHYELELNGRQAVICHGAGHLFELQDAAGYGDEYKRWGLENYPIIPKSFRIACKEDSKYCFSYVKGFFEKADLIINATDPDREGELIFYYVYSACGVKTEYKRAWVGDLTDAKIQKAFDNLIDGSEMFGLQQAGKARAISDWLIGINLTVAMTKKFTSPYSKDLLPIGRVQTPTLAMVVNRENEIKNHIKKPFWKIYAQFCSSSGELFEAEYAEKFSDGAEAEKLLRCLKNETQARITGKTSKISKISAPLLYNSTRLQADLADKFGWDLKKAADVIQALYEKKYITYPRTSSEHLTSAMQDEARQTINRLFGTKQYQEYSLDLAKQNPFSSRHFDDGKVGSHTAIIPTSKVPYFSSLSADEAAVYDLLVKSLLRIVYPPAEVEQTKLTINAGGFEFKTSGKSIINPGWYSVDALPDFKTVPKLSENEILTAVDFHSVRGVSEPPKRYTQASLILAMETAGQKVEDEQTRQLLKEQKKGLGTDATRAAVITGLLSKGLLAKKNQSLAPTEKGRFIIETLSVRDLKSADLTGEWEKKLNAVEHSPQLYSQYISDIKATTKQWFEEIKKSKGKPFSLSEKEFKCPKCGAKLLRSKSGGYICSAYESADCDFGFSGTVCGKKLTENQKEMLLSSGRTAKIQGFISKSGKKFSARLVISKDGKIEFLFDKEEILWQK